MEHPNLKDYTDCGLFLQHLIERATARNPRLSMRWFCKRLSWPPALINDVIAGRKTLSVQRALELARFLDCDTFDTERLVYMALATNPVDEVRNHFLVELRRGHGSDQAGDLRDPTLITDADSLLLFCLLGFLERRPDNETIRRCLPTAGSLTDAKIERVIERLKDHGLVTIAPDLSVQLDQIRFHQEMSQLSPEENLALTRAYMDNVDAYLARGERRKGGRGYVQLFTMSTSLAVKLQERFQQLMQRIWEEEAEVPEDVRAITADRNVFQIFFFIAPTLDTEHLPEVQRLMPKG